MTSAIIYTRFSPRPNADKCDSCEKQLERCEAYGNRMGYGPCYGVFDEKNMTGGDLNRPRLRAAIDSLKPGDVLIVDRSDRLARDMLVNLTIRHEVEQKGARIEYADGTMPDTTPMGRFLQNVLAAVGALQRDIIRERTKAGLARKKANGERSAGSIEIGKMLDPKNPKRLVDCPQEQRVLEAIRLNRYSGFSSERVAQIVTDIYGPCRGKPWSARTIRRILKRERENNAHDE